MADHGRMEEWAGRAVSKVNDCLRAGVEADDDTRAFSMLVQSEDLYDDAIKAFQRVSRDASRLLGNHRRRCEEAEREDAAVEGIRGISSRQENVS